jgi:hypothetical protein
MWRQRSSPLPTSPWGWRARPAQEAKVARDAFEDARRQLERDAEEATALVGAAIRRATATVIDPRAERLRESLRATLLAGTDADWQGTLATAAAWTREAEAALAGALAEELDRHAERLQERVNRFVQQPGTAFGVALPPAPDARQSLSIPPMRIEVLDEPGALEMGVRQLRHHLPSPLGQQWRERARRQRAVEEADRIVRALLRDAAASLLHRAGIRPISTHLRYHSQHPAAAVALLVAPLPADE